MCLFHRTVIRFCEGTQCPQWFIAGTECKETLFRSVLWYSDYGDETDVSLNCGRFYGPIVRPRMRMNEWMNEMDEWKNYFFYFRTRGSHGEMILTGENRNTRRKNCPSATLSTTNTTGLTRARTRAAAVSSAAYTLRSLLCLSRVY
jgi:hypothetical protein